MGLERAELPHVKWFKRIGDSSYSIYLWHIPVIVLGGHVLAFLHIASPALAIALLTVASLLVGQMLYELTERPLTAALFKQIGPRPAGVRGS